MLTLNVHPMELYDEQKEEFCSFPGFTVHLEHSLLAISMWEEKYHSSFFKKQQAKSMTAEEFGYYIKCMTVDDYPDTYIRQLRSEDLDLIEDYLLDSHTATCFYEAEENQQPKHRETITSELVYYWMVAAQIPFEAERWHINRLLTLIRICGIKNNPKKKRPMMDGAHARSINAARRAKLNSQG